MTQRNGSNVTRQEFEDFRDETRGALGRIEHKIDKQKHGPDWTAIGVGVTAIAIIGGIVAAAIFGPINNQASVSRDLAESIKELRFEMKSENAVADARLSTNIDKEIERNNIFSREISDVQAKVDALIADLDRRSADRFTGSHARDMRDMLMYLIQRNADDISELRGSRP